MLPERTTAFSLSVIMLMISVTSLCSPVRNETVSWLSEHTQEVMDGKEFRASVRCDASDGQFFLREWFPASRPPRGYYSWSVRRGQKFGTSPVYGRSCALRACAEEDGEDCACHTDVPEDVPEDENPFIE